MYVEVLHYPANYLDLLYFAARICYSEDDPKTLWRDVVETPTDQKIALLEHLWKAGHHSVFEHVTVTVLIDGVSRVCTHQLVRHRLCSYSQRSHRYTKNIQFVPPDQFMAMAPVLIEKDWELVTNFTKQIYDQLVHKGDYKPEFARYLLPECIATTIVVTANLRQWMHMFRLRLCNRAQWEIRLLFRKIFERFLTCFPELLTRRTFWPVDCINDKCKQGKQSCGYPGRVLRWFETTVDNYLQQANKSE